MATKKTTDTEAKVAKKATVKKETEKKATTKATAAKATAKKAEDKEIKKAATEAKAAKKETAAKKTTKTAEVMLQYGGKQISFDDIQAKVKEAWKNQFKMKLKDFVNVQIYIKPEDGKAYFVVNGDANVEYFVEL